MRVSAQQSEEMLHLLLRLQQAVIEIDVYDERTIFHLFSGDGACLVIFFLIDETQEFATSSHVASFADIDEAHFGRQRQAFHARKFQSWGSGAQLFGDAWLMLTDHVSQSGNMLRRCAAASPDDVHQPLFDIRFQLFSHLSRTLVVQP